MSSASITKRVAIVRERRVRRQARLLMSFAGLMFVMAVVICCVAVGRVHGRQKLASQEYELFDQINAMRASENRPALQINRSLTDIARKYARRKSQTPDMGLPPEDVLRPQMAAMGYPYVTLHLCLQPVGSEPNATDIFNQMMQDAGTRDQVLAAHQKDIGLAIVPGADGQFYLAQFIASK